MEEQFSRMKMLFGDAAIAGLAKSRVAVFGIGRSEERRVGKEC